MEPINKNTKEKPADYSEYEEVKSKDNLMEQIGLAAKLQHEIEQAIAHADDHMKELKKRLKDVCEFQLPELMEEADLDTFTSRSTGITISIKETIRAAIPKRFIEQATDWLEKNGHGGLVKRKFNIAFDREDEAWANKFERDLAQRKKPLNVDRTKSVHAQTLGSFVREQLKEGEEIPEELFGVFRERKAKVSV